MAQLSGYDQTTPLHKYAIIEKEEITMRKKDTFISGRAGLYWSAADCVQNLSQV
jgi:hypothetical protein